jgi:3',5'-cyclic AMP phosphodiesterase CpdA
MPSKFTWLHLSDLHMEQEDAFNRSRVIEALLDDLRKWKSKGVCPDLVLFSGDIAYHGSEEEYELANEEFFDKLLPLLNLAPEALILAPGNHDLRRALSENCPNPLSECRSEEDLLRNLTDKDKMRLFLLPFCHFETFGKKYSDTASYALSPAYANVNAIQKDGKRIVVVTLNTAIGSSYNKDASGQIADQGHLAISEHQVNMAKDKIGNADLTITLMHHPLDWLVSFDRERVERLIFKNSDVVLSGHLHTPYTAVLVDRTSATLIVRAGSVFDTRTSPNNYNIVELDLDSRIGNVFLRRYNGFEWVKDNDSIEDEANGIFPFSLSEHGSIDLPGPDLLKEVKTFTLTQRCRDDLKRIGITEEDLTALVKTEFHSHKGYLLSDLESYPMPVRGSYIVYLTKRESRVEMFRVIYCTRDAAALEAWKEILRLYRRAIRLEYRQDSKLLMRSASALRMVIVLHQDVRKLIVDFFQEYRGQDVSSTSARIRESVLRRYADGRRPLDRAGTAGNNLRSEISSVPKGIQQDLCDSEAACKEALEIQRQIRCGNVGVDRGYGDIVAELEKSLQHLHQIILNFPPG